MKNYWILFFTSLTLLTSAVIFHQSKKQLMTQQPVALDSFIHDDIQPAKLVAATDNKTSKNTILRKLYTKVEIDTLKLPGLDGKFLKAMENQMTLLKKAEDENFDGLNVEVDDLEKVIDVFRKAKTSAELLTSLDAYQLSGSDSKGSVRFTGYYSPVIAARRASDAVYKYPIYLAQSDEKVKTNAKKAKSDKSDLKVAFVRDRHDIYSMRLEGAAYLQFPDGDRQLVSFDGDYHVVESEEKQEENHDLLANDNGKSKKVLTTYSVFTEKEKPRPVGAAKVPLTTDFSVAVDKSYIPLGAVLLAEIPIIDEKGNFVRSELRFILAQDTGSAIIGSGHIDLYMGEGEAGRKRIEFMNQSGRVWLLLPKEAAEKKLLAQNL